MRASPTSPTASGWRYRPAGIAGAIEFGEWLGGAPPRLRPHFHDEDQIVFVLSGSRSFVAAGMVITAMAGQAVCIPAGMLHAPCPTPEATICLNAYLPATDARRWKPAGFPLARILVESDDRIGDIAAGLGRSREGFSRLARRELGVAPHGWRILARLNLARRMLRDGQPIAAVAAETGFSDQSHLTRLFRQTFGTTPGLYRRA